MEAYNGGLLFGNITGAMAREILMLGLNTKTEGDVEKLHVSARVKYLATAFLLSLDMYRYRELILSLKNDYAKQQKNYPKTLTDMYRLMVAFYTSRETLVSGRRNEGLNFWNVAVESGTAGEGNHGSGSGTGRKLECW